MVGRNLFRWEKSTLGATCRRMFQNIAAVDQAGAFSPVWPATVGTAVTDGQIHSPSPSKVVRSMASSASRESDSKPAPAVQALGVKTAVPP